MRKELSLAWKGRCIWKKLRRAYGIDYRSVVLLLPETDREWNIQALRHLPDYVRRKSAARALVLSAHPDNRQLIQEYLSDDQSRSGTGASTGTGTASLQLMVDDISAGDAGALLQYYCFYKFYENIVFLYLDRPKDNYSSLILEQGCVSKEELICLGFYHLREVPVHV